MKHKFLFGPVPSRRLGVSLGVDLIPHKTCSLDCIYCECGKTTRLTTKRKEYVPVETVLMELDSYLAGSPSLDYITFAGSGEPTLNSGMGKVISFIKEKYSRYKICLLTNGTLFTDKSVRDDAGMVDLIIPSLDAASEDTFQRINRPHSNLSCKNIIEGLVDLRREYSGEICMEIFIVPGINDTDNELSALKEALKRISPNRIQLGTLDRPGTEEWVEAADPLRMQEIAGYLKGAELIGDFKPRNRIASFQESKSRQIIQTLRRRPCTALDLEQILNLHQAELQKYINHLLEQKRIEVNYKERGAFFTIKIPD